MSHTPNTPVPSEDQYRQQLAVLDASLAGLPESETLTAIRDVVARRYDLALGAFGPRAVADRGVDQLRFLADASIEQGIPESRDARLAAAAILLASLEVDAYEGRA